MMAAPVNTEICITVGGVEGIASATFPLADWNRMPAASRVLALHDRLRHVTQGTPFDVLAERLHQ